MDKKGIEATMLIMLVIAAVIISISSILFLKFKANVLGNCDINNLQYLGDLPVKLSSMSGPRGWNSRESFSFSVPCGDRAFFIDLNKINEEIKKAKDDPSYKSQIWESFNSEPLIKNEFESGTGNNFIIMNGPRMVSATKLEGLSLDYPYNLCFDTKVSRKVNIEMEGRGGDGVNVIPYCEQLECTQVPEILQPNEKKKLLYTICGGTNDACANQCGKTYEDCYKACDPANTGCKNTCDTNADNCYKNTCALGDQACYDTEKQNIENADGNVEVRLRVSTCFPEKTKVEFLVKPKDMPPGQEIAAKAVKIFETVPKDCIDNFGGVLQKVEGGQGDVIINPDPMLVWSFDTLSKEERVAYHLSKFLDDRCRKQLKAVASAALIVRDAVKDSPSDIVVPLDRPIEQITKADLDPVFAAKLESQNVFIPSTGTIFVTSTAPGEPIIVPREPTTPLERSKTKRIRQHRPRHEGDDSKRPRTPLPAEYTELPADLKGDDIMIREGAGGTRDTIIENTAPRFVDGKDIQSVLLPISLSLDNEIEDMLGESICNYVVDTETPCSSGELEFRIRGGQNIADCEIKDLKLSCEGKREGTVELNLIVRDQGNLRAEKAFTLTVES